MYSKAQYQRIFNYYKSEISFFFIRLIEYCEKKTCHYISRAEQEDLVFVSIAVTVIKEIESEICETCL